jgi:four helix bundle protein
MSTYKDLIVWQKGMELSRVVYRLCMAFPREETFCLSSQMRRAVVSIPSNIAEGYGRDSDNEKVHFMHISLGSAFELETQLMLSHDLKFVGDEEYTTALQLVTEVKKMLSSLIYRLRFPRSTSRRSQEAY